MMFFTWRIKWLRVNCSVIWCHKCNNLYHIVLVNITHCAVAREFFVWTMKRDTSSYKYPMTSYKPSMVGLNTHIRLNMRHYVWIVALHLLQYDQCVPFCPSYEKFPYEWELSAYDQYVIVGIGTSSWCQHTLTYSNPYILHRERQVWIFFYFLPFIGGKWKIVWLIPARWVLIESKW